jgi:hypothetical protein
MGKVGLSQASPSMAEDDPTATAGSSNPDNGGQPGSAQRWNQGTGSIHWIPVARSIAGAERAGPAQALTRVIWSSLFITRRRRRPW